MTLTDNVREADWVRATADNGSVIEGQADHDMSLGGYAHLTIVIKGNEGDRAQKIQINVNFWDVVPLRRNLR